MFRNTQDQTEAQATFGAIRHSGFNFALAAAPEPSPYKMELFPLDTEYVGKINVGNNINDEKTTGSINTVIILDCSGSMGDSVKRLANVIFPLFLDKLSYNSAEVIHIRIITFESFSKYYKTTVDGLEMLDVTAGSSTLMGPGVKQCKVLFEGFNVSSREKGKPIRLLTISDGLVHDPFEISKEAQSLLDYAKGKFWINSQAVRFFVHNNQPDTSALASLLQLNETSGITTKLVDISATETDESVAIKIANLFISDNISNVFKDSVLTTPSKNILNWPWETTATSEIKLHGGENLIWFNKFPSGTLKVNEKPLKVQEENALNLPEFQDLMEDKMDFIVDHMKVLKVVGTGEANETVQRMVEYFDKKEEALAKTSTFKKKNISNVLKQIADDGKVKELDEAEKANYLRQNVTINNDKPPKNERATQTENQVCTFPENNSTEPEPVRPHTQPSWVSEILGVNIDDFDRKERLMFVLVILTLISILLK